MRKMDQTKDALKLLEENDDCGTAHEARYGRVGQEIHQYPQPLYIFFCFFK